MSFRGDRSNYLTLRDPKKKTITNDILKNHGGGTTMIGNIHHSSRTISNMERSLAFYRDLLGF